MSSKIEKFSWWFIGVLSTLVGLYPIIYFLIDDRNFGLFASKTDELLANQIWNIGFYGHIVFGGIALLIGWIQFNKKLRKNKLNLHRTVGKIYALSVLISSLCGIYIGFFATGGIISSTGFISLGIIWLLTTISAFNSVKKGDINKHQKMMIYSYAACFAAVTLRLWLPILTSIMGEYIPAYQIVAWLCWVPNIIVAYFITLKFK